MLLQLIEANTETLDLEKDLIVLNIELDKFREKYFPNSYLEKYLRNQKTLRESKSLKNHDHFEN